MQELEAAVYTRGPRPAHRQACRKASIIAALRFPLRVTGPATHPSHHPLVKHLNARDRSGAPDAQGVEAAALVQLCVQPVQLHGPHPSSASAKAGGSAGAPLHSTGTW